MTPLEKLEGLDRTKRHAFLALFAGARMPIQVLTGPDGKEWPVMFGKAECEWVDDWRDFYGRELGELGFATFSETEPRRALGAAPGSMWTHVTITITEEGWLAREAYWNRVNA